MKECIIEKTIKKIREIDLGRMKSTKYGNFGGVWARTSYSAFFVLDSILNILKPDVIVEIGTWRGGLSCYLKTWSSLSEKSVSFLTIDIEDLLSEEVRSYLKDSFVQTDSFSEKGLDLVKQTSDLKSTCIYCDGGNKEKELETFSRFIGSGSIIGCHDYGTEVDPEKVREFMKDDFVEIFTMEQIKELGNLQQFWMRKRSIQACLKRTGGRSC